MKKNLAIVVIIMFFCLFTISCSGGLYGIVKNNMSDIRFTFFEGMGDDYNITLSCGMREEIYEYNGTSTKNVECGVVCLTFNSIKPLSLIKAEVTVDGNAVNYILELSPYENVYMCDIQKNVLSDSEVYVKIENQDNSIKLLPVSNEWQIDYTKALKIGTDHLKEQIKSLYFNKSFHGECYLKPITKFGYKNVFWYFSVIDMGGSINNCLIDVQTGKIIA